jgi:O-6-methylguanine DNA methyltransferase
MHYLLIAQEPHLTVHLHGGLEKVSLSLPSTPGFHLSLKECSLSDDLLAPLVAWLNSYAKRAPLPLPELFQELPVSPFTERVLKALIAIPFGKTLSYSEMAAALQKPKAARAVGNACGSNPFALFIPCHRILAAGHRIGGFGYGIEVKQRLLNFEKSLL